MISQGVKYLLQCLLAFALVLVPFAHAMMRKLLSGLIAAALLLAGCARADENFDTMTCAQYMELSKKPDSNW
jgi:hypothetical protein